MAQFKIAWGITGAGHLLRESIKILEQVLSQGIRMDVFVSAAGETVLKMYGLLDSLQKAHQKYDTQFKRLIFDKDQVPGYPICAKFNLHSYDALILSPLSANSVAKMNVGIADTLITNIFSQMVKGNGPIYIVPCDLFPGKLHTEIPGGKKVEITIDNFNSQNARNLRKFPTVRIISHPNDVIAEISTLMG